MTREDLLRAQKKLDINDVYLYSTESGIKKEDFFPKFSDVNLKPLYKTTITGLEKIGVESNGEETSLVNFYIKFSFRLFDGNVSDLHSGMEEIPDDEVLAYIDASFVAEYSIVGEEGFNFEEDEDEKRAIYAFGQYNLTYQVWPYWREYLQNTCARLRLPIINLPLFKPATPPKSEEGESP